MTRDELVALRRRAGNLRSRDLRRAAEECGYVYEESVGGHHIYRKEGTRRPLVIQHAMKPGTAAAIINRLLQELDDEE